jgi:trigger factor
MTNELRRTIDIELPDSQIERALNQKFPFRHGKLPAFSYLRKKYGDDFLTEILQALLTERINTEIAALKMDIASGIEVMSLWNTWDQPLRYRYRVQFEVFPEFTLQGLDALTMPAIAPVRIDDAQVDAFIEIMRRERSPWRHVNRCALPGDRVVINFNGTIDGETFPGGRGQAAKIELGAGGMLPAFEHALMAAMPDEDLSFPITFPADYQTSFLAGKTAQFEVHIVDIQAIDLLPLDDEFAKRFGVTEGIAAMREGMRKNLERQHQEQDQRDISNSLLTQLAAANPIPLPDSLVDQHIRAIQAEMAPRAGHPTEQIYIDAGMIATARHRTHLGILVRELIKTEHIEVDASQIDVRMESMAAAATGAPAELIRHNPAIIQQVRAELLQERVINWLIFRAKQNTDTVASRSSIRKDRTMHNPFHRHHHSHSHEPPFAAIITDAFLHVRYHRHTHHGAHTVSTVTLKGTTPIARTDGSALALTDIASIDVFDDVGDGNGPQNIGSVPNPGATFEFTTGVLTAGVTHNFTVVVNDTTGHKSAPSNAIPIPVPATLAAPNAVADLVGTLNA